MSQEEFATPNAPVDQSADSAPAPEQTVVEIPADQPADSAPAEDTPPQEEAPPEQSKAVKELIAQRKKRQVAEQEAAYWKGVAEGRVEKEPAVQKPAPTVSAATPPVMPDPTAYDSYDRFEDAERQYIIDSAKYAIRAEQQAEREALKQREQVSKFQAKINAAAATDPTIHEIIADRSLPISNDMAQLIQHSDSPVELIKYLSGNREESLRIANMPPILAARELGIIEAKITAKPIAEPTKKVSQAPAPITTIAPAGSSVVEEADLPIDQFIARRNKARHGR